MSSLFRAYLDVSVAGGQAGASPDPRCHAGVFGTSTHADGGQVASPPVLSLDQAMRREGTHKHPFCASNGGNVRQEDGFQAQAPGKVDGGDEVGV